MLSEEAVWGEVWMCSFRDDGVKCEIILSFHSTSCWIAFQQLISLAVCTFCTFALSRRGAVIPSSWEVVGCGHSLRKLQSETVEFGEGQRPFRANANKHRLALTSLPAPTFKWMNVHGLNYVRIVSPADTGLDREFVRDKTRYFNFACRKYTPVKTVHHVRMYPFTSFQTGTP